MNRSRFPLSTIAITLMTAVLFPQQAGATHPSIFFSAGDVAAIRTKATTTHAAIMQPIASCANSLLPLPVPTAPTGAASSDLSLDSRDVTVLAFAYVATGDSRYLALARQYLAAFAAWPVWGADAMLGDRDLSLGYMLRGCAMAYDWLYDSLSAADRAAIRNALVKHSQEMYEAASGPYNAAWGNWWPESYGQNHWDNNNTALGIAALVLDGECDSGATWLSHVIAEMRRDSFDLANIGDGTWHEGCLYQDSKLTATMPFYFNLKRLRNIDLYPHNYLSQFALFALYNYLPLDRQMALDFSSYIDDWGGWLSAAGYSLLALAGSECGSGYGQWLWNKMGTDLGRSSYQAGNHVPEFFYYSPSAPSTAPTGLPLYRTFTDLQGVIWRTGWGDSDLTFGLKTGAYGGTFLYNQYLSKKYPFDTAGANLNVGHNHADANTFWLYRGNATIVGENEGRSLYNDLGTAYQSSSHNTLLVDGRGQYFPTNQTGVYANNDGGLKSVCNVAGYDFVESDASKRCRSTNTDGSMGPFTVSLFVRNVLFVRPLYFIIVDNVADSAAHAYELRFHCADSAIIDTTGGWVRALSSGGNVLGIKTLSPVPFAYDTVDSAKPAVLIRPPQAVKRADFVHVLYPTQTSAWPARPQFSLANQTLSATVVHVSGSVAFDHIIRHADAADTVTAGNYVIDGNAASVGRAADGSVKDLFLAAGTFVADSAGRRPLLQSAAAVNAVHASITDTAVTVWLDEKSALNLRLYAPQATPSMVRVPGRNASATAANGYLTITETMRVAPGSAVRPGCPAATFSFDKRHGAVRILSSRPGNVTVRLYRLNGKCMWKSGETAAGPGQSISVPIDLRRRGHATYIVRVEINGAAAGQSLVQLAE